MSTTKPGLNKILAAYIECALWSSTHFEDENDANGTPFDEVEAELAPATRESMEKDCADFMDYCDEVIGDEWHAGQSFEQIGHDFWLTRNGHGAGFWDRGLGELGTKLSDAAKTFGSVDLYLGDDGLIYAQ